MHTHFCKLLLKTSRRSCQDDHSATVFYHHLTSQPGSDKSHLQPVSLISHTHSPHQSQYLSPCFTVTLCQTLLCSLKQAVPGVLCPRLWESNDRSCPSTCVKLESLPKTPTRIHEGLCLCSDDNGWSNRYRTSFLTLPRLGVVDPHKSKSPPLLPISRWCWQWGGVSVADWSFNTTVIYRMWQCWLHFVCRLHSSVWALTCCTFHRSVVKSALLCAGVVSDILRTADGWKSLFRNG